MAVLLCIRYIVLFFVLQTAEEKISRQEEAFIIAKAMQEKVLAFSNLQKENEKYKDENQLLK